VSYGNPRTSAAVCMSRTMEKRTRTMENWTSCLIDPRQWRRALRKEKRRHDAMTTTRFEGDPRRSDLRVPNTV